MSFPRSSGILLHPTSLPGRFGVGDLGPEAYRYVDFLASAGQRIWQVLPLGPTGYGDSPYQLFSAFAGNPLLISLDRLADDGYLAPAELESVPTFPADKVDYGPVIRFKMPLLRLAYERFRTSGPPEEFGEFRARHGRWLNDYALFMALKQAHGGERIWSRWEPDIAARQPQALEKWKARLATEIEALEFIQFAFFRQWRDLQNYARERGIRIMGDLPIYVAHDSADVWTNPELFQLDANGDTTVMSGVPPDYFSATGQLWGNPIYRWDRMAADRLPLVDRTAAGGADSGGHRARRPFPRPGSLLGSAGRRDYRQKRPLGKGPRPSLVRSLGERAGPPCRSWPKTWA